MGQTVEVTVWFDVEDPARICVNGSDPRHFYANWSRLINSYSRKESKYINCVITALISHTLRR